MTCLGAIKRGREGATLLLAAWVIAGALVPETALARTDGPDAGGYHFVDNLTVGGPVYAYEDISASPNALPLFTDPEDNDEAVTVVSLPFQMPLYGSMVQELTVGTNGVLYFEDSRYLGYSTTECMPGQSQYDPENFLMAPFWDDLQVAPSGTAQVYFEVRGEAPNRRAIVQFHKVRRYATTGELQFEVILHESTGDILYQYKAVDTLSTVSTLGGRALVGLQRDPDVGLSYGCKQKVLSAGLAILFTSRWDLDDDGVNRLTDCDDEDADVYPGTVGQAAPEVCDGKDNDCDGQIDEDELIFGLSWYPDTDGDGYGVGAASFVACEAPQGYGSEPGDCNDSNPSVNPGEPELCNGYDDNCDGVIDTDAQDRTTYYRDYDQDGFGTADIITVACQPPSSRDVLVGGDCDDRDANAYPGGTEFCDSDDNDCDTIVDEEATDTLTIYLDIDGDGYGGDADTFQACVAPDESYVYQGGDCQDNNTAVNPGRSDVCNGVDDDCSGAIDDNALDGTTYYPDADSDSYPYPTGQVVACVTPEGYSEPRVNGSGVFVWDCDDENPQVHPTAVEVCNGIDDDCDQRRDEGYDIDADGVADCLDSCPSDPKNDVDGDGVCGNLDNCPTVANPLQEDVNRNGIGDACETEVCDGLDNDGDGTADEDFADSDSDGAADCVDPCIDDPEPDTDGDGVCSDDNCPSVSNRDQLDTDGDGLGDDCDLCPEVEDDGQDSDYDTIGDACDNCPDDPNFDQSDSDADGVGDACAPESTPTVTPPETPAETSAPETSPDVTDTPVQSPEPTAPPTPTDGPTEPSVDTPTPTEPGDERCGCDATPGAGPSAALQGVALLLLLAWRRFR